MKKSYYNENRYFDADVTDNKINLEIDTNSPVYTNYEHDTLDKIDSIKKLEEFISKDSVIRDIIDSIPTTDIKKRIILTIEETNKIYSFSCLKLESEYTYVQIFDIVTEYIRIEPKDFYHKLSIKYREQILKELETTGHYKSNALF